MHKAQHQTLFWCHLCETGDLQALLQLQQTSMQLQAEVAQILQGQRQLPVAFSTLKQQQLCALQQWLLMHAGLVKGLQLQVDPYSIAGSFTQRPYRLIATGANDFIGTAAQRAVSSLLAVAAGDSILLQSLTLRGSTASHQFLQQLPAAHLTELHAEVSFKCRDSMQALAALSRLRRLVLEGPKHRRLPWAARRNYDRDPLAPLAAGLQQLTELHINPFRPAQLHLLPPKLQQLHIIGSGYMPLEVLQLAKWVHRKGSVLRSLTFCSFRHHWKEGGEAALTALAAAFAAAAAAPAASAAAATAPAPAPAAGTGLQLASLSVQGLSSDIAPAAPLLMALPASSLTHLDCHISWATEADVAALCSLTGLQNLQLQQGWRLGPRADDAGGVYHSVAGQPDSVLAQLSVLQQLTRLELLLVRRVQLQHLDVIVADTAAGAPLLLGHMTALTALAVESVNGLSPADQLPPQLTMLKLVLGGYDYKDPSSSAATNNNPRSISLQPVLGLGQLQKLQLDMQCVDGAVPAAEELAQLSTLRSLQEVRVVWDSWLLGDDATVVGIAAALAVLPVKTLTWRHAGMSAASMQQLGCLQGLTSLDLEGTRMRDTQDYVTVERLAVALPQLAALQCLKLGNVNSGDLASAAEADNLDGVVELLQAVDGLKHLFAISVCLPVRLKDAAVTQLHMQQLVPNLLARGCTVELQGLHLTSTIRICMSP
jgi:hypothetical protein